jgi:hypothetical protein
MSLLPPYRASLPGLPRPAVFDFMNASLPSGASLTRASTGWYFDPDGVLQSATTDEPRWTCNPSSGALQGLSVEPAATNSIRNASAGGASAGTPGTLPTSWGSSFPLNSLVRSVVGSGTEDGIPYLDVRISGTPSTTLESNVVVFEGATQIAAAMGQTWIGSFFYRLSSGALTNTTLRQAITERTAAGAVLGTSRINITPTGSALKTQRSDLSRTLSDASAGAVLGALTLGYTSGQPVDLTLRIGLPQLVQAPAASSPIVTTSAAVTRAADVLPLALADGTYMVALTRLAGSTLVKATVSGGSWTVPTSVSPLQRVAAWRIG